MKIYTITTEGEDGTETQVFLTETEQHSVVTKWLDDKWDYEFDRDRPEDTLEALEVYQDSFEHNNFIWIETHEVSEQIEVLAAYGYEVVEEVIHGETDLKVLNKLEGTADIFTFDTKAEAQAYTKGAKNSEGWNNQWVETL